MCEQISELTQYAKLIVVMVLSIQIHVVIVLIKEVLRND